MLPLPAVFVVGLVAGHLVKRRRQRVGSAVAPAVAVVIPAETQAILRQGRSTRQRREAPSGETLSHLFVDKAVQWTLLEEWQQKASDDYDRDAALYKQGRVTVEEPEAGVVTTAQAVTAQTLEKSAAIYEDIGDQIAEVEASLDKLREALVDIYGPVAHQVVCDRLDRAIAKRAQSDPTLAAQYPKRPQWGSILLLLAMAATKTALEDDQADWEES